MTTKTERMGRMVAAYRERSIEAAYIYRYKYGRFVATSLSETAVRIIYQHPYLCRY